MGTVFALLVFVLIPTVLFGVIISRLGSQTPGSGRPLGNWVAGLIGAAGAIVLMLAWLGWSPELTEPAAWQVIGLVVTGLLAAGVTMWLTRSRWAGPLSVALGAAVGAAVAFTIASGGDESGVWAAGLLFTYVGVAVGFGLLGVLIAVVRVRSHQ